MCPKSQPERARFGIDLAKPGSLAEIPKLNANCPAAGVNNPFRFRKSVLTSKRTRPAVVSQN